jgi:CRP/FNR family transcriptional regulator, cyclic AMP receptor protein
LDTSQLKRIPLFADTPDDDLRVVSTFAEAKEVPEGTVIMKEGGFANELMALEEGTAEVLREGKKVGELKQGDIFGEAGLLEKTERNASVVATSTCRLIVIKQWEMHRMKSKLPHLVEEIQKTLAERRGG